MKWLAIPVLVAVFAAGCSGKPGRPSVGTITPGFVELAQIKLEPTGAFTIEMPQPDGQLLYRSPEAIINLSHCDVNKTEMTAYSGLHAMKLKLKPEFENKYKEWVESHPGEWVAHIINGKVRYFGQIQPPIEGQEPGEVEPIEPIVVIGPMRDVAEKYCYWTQAGGSPDPAEIAALEEE